MDIVRGHLRQRFRYVDVFRKRVRQRGARERHLYAGIVHETESPQYRPDFIGETAIEERVGFVEDDMSSLVRFIHPDGEQLTDRPRRRYQQIRDGKTRVPHLPANSAADDQRTFERRVSQEVFRDSVYLRGQLSARG